MSLRRRLIFVLIAYILSIILTWILYLGQFISYSGGGDLLNDGKNDLRDVISNDSLQDAKTSNNNNQQHFLRRPNDADDEDEDDEDDAISTITKRVTTFNSDWMFETRHDMNNWNISTRQTYDTCRGIHWNEITISLPRHSFPVANSLWNENRIQGRRDYYLLRRINDIVSMAKLHMPPMESEDSSNRTVLIIPNALQPSHDYDYYDMKNQHDGGNQSTDTILYRRENRKFDITMVTHMGVGKYTRFRVLVQRWNGPISVAVIIHNLMELDAFHSFVSDNVQVLHNVVFHYYIEYAPELRMAYPQNVLRNLALDHIQTDYFLVNDVDIFPSPLHTHDLLRDTIASHWDIQEKINNDTFFAIPMFDLHEMIEDEDLIYNHPSFPESRRDALRMNATGAISQHLATRHPRGHRAINYTQWFATIINNSTDTAASSVSYAIKHENKFEPYVVGSKLPRHNGGNIPPYYPYYRGFGFDKYSWYAELEFAGFKLEVLRDFFMFHANHKTSYGNTTARGKLFATNKFCSQGFMKDIVKKYGEQDNALWDDWMKNVYDT